MIFQMVSSFHPFRKSGRIFLTGFFLFALFIAPVAFASDLKWTAESLPDYDQLFQRTNGWIGADGDFTVALPNDDTLWLFSDTFVGDVRDGHRQNATMIHNSAAWQHGKNPANASVEFFYNQSADGKPKSLVTPADGKGWFWIFDATLADGKLFLLLPQFEHATSKSAAFGFRQTGLWLGEIANPLDPPPQWKITQTKIPFWQSGTNESRNFGSAVLATNGFVYIFGTHDVRGRDRKMLLARVPENSLADFSSWQFRTQTDWSTNVADAADLCGRMASEYSVSWLPKLNQFVLVVTDNGLSPKIILRTAPNPRGPWSDAKVIYRCPDVAWDKRIFCYAAKAHPMLAQSPDELILTYAANSYEFSKLMGDARLYWPRFVRVRFNR
jgi:hypothetical protein